MDTLDALRTELVEAVRSAPDADTLEAVRITALGKKGRITDLMKSLGQMDPDERRRFGQAVNAVKDEVAALLESRRAAFAEAALDTRLAAERVDVTLPVRPETSGTLHPISQTWDEVVAIFGQMGFTVAEGPDIEDDFHNFTALNFPPGHPAREMHDTFFLAEQNDGTRNLLRTHTSPVQIRTMLAQKPPIRVIIPGRTYRCDSDMTHTPMFHQIEGLVIDREISFADMAGTLEAFTSAYFGGSIHSRLRPSYFPFTEPSAEYDINCVFCEGAGCRTCSHTGWLELGGCGMVHPNVLRNVGLDGEEWTGFAFGFGLDRLALMRHGVDDIREMYTGDIRFLEQFPS